MFALAAKRIAFVLCGAALGTLAIAPIAPLVAQYNPANYPPYVPGFNAGTDVICAKAGDTITGFPCNNQTVDGTTETAFKTTIKIPAGFGNGSFTMNLQVGQITTGTTPIATMSVRVGGAANVAPATGTLIFTPQAAIAGANTSGALRVIYWPCGIKAIGKSSATTPIIFGCGIGGSIPFAGASANTLPASPALSIPIDTRTAKLVTVTVSWSANTAGNAMLLYGIAP